MKVKIMRGLPGSGKSTYAKRNFPDAIVCSADLYFTNGMGEYNFKPAELPRAHARCLLKFVEWLDRAAISERDPESNRELTIVVDNTNVDAVSLAPYISLAIAYEADIEVITMSCDVQDAAKRNVHNVPIHAIDRMYKTMQEFNPPAHWVNWTAPLIVEWSKVYSDGSKNLGI